MLTEAQQRTHGGYGYLNDFPVERIYRDVRVGDRRMIARTWRGRTSTARADGYALHFTNNVLPELKKLPGHRGAYLLRREAEGNVEFTAVTLWESRDSIRAFAGADISKAHVEPEARAALSDFDLHADHYDVVVSAVS